jgi:hypothetical protein
MAVSRISDRRLRELQTTKQEVDLRTQSLERRLIEGERQIAMAEARGEDTNRLVDFWVDLLHQYERSVDQLPHAA